MKTDITKKIDSLINKLELEIIPVEGCYVKKTYLSDYYYNEKQKIASHMYGLYSPEKESQSCFHKLTCDELWHFYDGDPITLSLIYPDGKFKEVILSSDFAIGVPTFLIPSGVWQAGKTSDGGQYSLFGCTVMPSFTDRCFSVETKEELLKKYPNLESVIEEFGYVE
jgi:predicted cupin superfamily sugar epimerase